MKKTIRAVIFDMDGLMIDTEKLYWAAGREIAARFGKTVEDATLGRMMGRSPVDSLRVFAEELGLPQDPADLLAMRDELVLVALGRGLDTMPRLFEVLDTLRSRFKLAIATSAPLRFLEVVLRQLNLGRYFDALQTSDGVQQGKPFPEIYLKAMAKLAVPPEQCVVLEDSSNGALAGKRAGAYVIAVPSMHTRDQDFAFVDYVATDLRDAQRHILEIAQPA